MSEEIKANRAKVKRTVTNSIRKLKSSILFDADETTLKEHQKLLETQFDQLNILHLEYEDVSGLLDGEYLDEITQAYESVTNDFYKLLKANNEIKQKKDLWMQNGNISSLIAFKT